MLNLSGTKIASGLAIGKPFIIEHKPYRISDVAIAAEDIEKEMSLFKQAVDFCVADLDAFLQLPDITESEREILSTHSEILKDPDMKNQVRAAITKDLNSAAKATHRIFSNTIKFFAEIENEVFALKAADYKDVAHKLLTYILGDDSDTSSDLCSEHIPILHEINPSTVSRLYRLGIRAYLCEKGSYSSHSAILSRALGMAAMANIPELISISKGVENIILDAENESVILDPDDEALELFAHKVQIEELIRLKQEKLHGTESVTKDGQAIRLLLNIGLPEELDKVLELPCDGIGLFRTEFLYLTGNRLPTEEEQYRVYSKIASALSPRPVTIRTFDLGGDKLSHLIPAAKESNPYLGNRGIRFSLAHPELFKTQLRAIIRASAHGKIRIMFPMVIDVDDFVAGRDLYNTCVDELYYEGYDYDSAIELGSMVEIPSAALNSDALAKECDFLSLGTNDLVQYTLAVDRNNEAVSRYYISHHPAVLKLIRATVNNAALHNKPLSVCGEMASMPEYIALLIGMGIYHLSMNPASFYPVKGVVRQCDEKLRKIVKHFDFSTSLPQVTELVYRTLKPYTISV